MTGDPGEREDILGFGDTSRGSRGRGTLVLRLDRLALRATRRPVLLAAVACLVVVLGAGALTYLPVMRPAPRPAAAAPRPAAGGSGQCLDASQYRLLAAALGKIAEQAERITGRPPPSAGGSGIVLGYVSGSGSWTQFSIAVPRSAAGAGSHGCRSLP
jgi:hypothetical protein